MAFPAFEPERFLCWVRVQGSHKQPLGEEHSCHTPVNGRTEKLRFPQQLSCVARKEAEHKHKKKCTIDVEINLCNGEPGGGGGESGNSTGAV